MMWLDRGAIRTYQYYHNTFHYILSCTERLSLNNYKSLPLHADQVDLRISLVQFLSLDWEEHYKSLSFISSSRLTSFSSFYSDSPPWQNSSLLHHHLVIFIFCLISFDVISIHHHLRHHHSCRQFLLDYHVLLLHTHSLHTYFCPIFHFCISFSSSYAFFYCYSSSPHLLLLRSLVLPNSYGPERAQFSIGNVYQNTILLVDCNQKWCLEIYSYFLA
jgi:hypothetical protein